MAYSSRTIQELIEENTLLKQRIRSLELSEIQRNLASESKRAEESLQTIGNRAYRQRIAIGKLAIDDAISFGDVPTAMRKLTEECSAALQVERASVWLLSEDDETLRCASLYEAEAKQHSEGTTLKSADYPRYFEAIRSESRINAGDARTDPRTREFTPDYLTPLGITSMLDAGIQIAGKLAGVVCFEHVGEQRSWHPDEEAFASTVSALVAQTLANATRKQTENALRESEERYRTLIENASDIIFKTDATGHFTFVNQAGRRNAGYEEKEVIGKEYWSLVRPDMREDAVRFFGRQFVKGLQNTYCEFPIVTKDGREIWLGQNTSLLVENGHVSGFQAMARDITDRKQTEDALRESEDKLAKSYERITSILDSLDSLVYVADFDSYEILFINKYGHDIFGDVQGRKCWQAIQTDQKGPCSFCSNDRLLSDSGIPTGVYQWEFQNTTNGRWYECRDQAISWIGKTLVRMEIATDITDRKRTEEALGESELFNRGLVENLPDYIIVYGTDGKILYVNAATEVALGYSAKEVIGTSVLSHIAEEYRDEVISRMKVRQGRREAPAYEIDIVAQDGHQRPVIVKGTPIRYHDSPAFLILLVDITERKRAEAQKAQLEAQNRQLQKAESLGRMAGAIAHTFNNQLGAVIGNLEMAIEDLPQGVGPVNRLTTAMHAANKAAEVSGQMLTYLGQSFGKREPLDIAETCRRNLSIIEAAMPGTVVLETSLPSLGPSVMANGNQIQQVLTNLISNAWEAVGAGRGSVHLSVKTVSPPDIPHSHRFPVGWQPKDSIYACMEVADTGDGIAHNDIEKIFDPFFSSKFTGRGLGLSMVLGIVKGHGGAVTVESEQGRGSTFRVFFPVSAEEVPRQPVEMIQASATEGGGTVLLVEDEDMVRDMAKTMIMRLGFTVLEATDGVEAVEIFRQHQDEIRCVLTDMTMPRMNGWETLMALRKLAPDIPVILASGYDKAHVMAGDHPELPQVFLGKPYKLKGLGDAIRQALANRK